MPDGGNIRAMMIAKHVGFRQAWPDNRAPLAGGSLRDVQALAGHADLKTTSRYIETDPDAQRKLVDLI
jgi:integrase